MSKLNRLYFGLKRIYVKLTFANKILLLNYCIIILVFIILGSYFYNDYNKNITADIKNLQDIQVKALSDNINTVTENAENISTLFILNPFLQQLLKLTRSEASLITENENNYSNTSIELLINLLVSERFVSSICFYSDNGFSFFLSKNNKHKAINMDKKLENSHYIKSMELKGKPYWLVSDDNFNNDFDVNYKNELIMMRSVLNSDSFKTMGTMFVTIDLNEVAKVYKTQEQYCYIITNNDKISFLDTNIQDLKNVLQLDESFNSAFKDFNGDQFITNMLGTQHIITAKQTNIGFNLLNIAPISMFTSDLNISLISAAFVFIFCLVIAFCLSLLTTRMITKPINNLIDGIEQVKIGNFHKEVEINSLDEFGKLGSNYNEMIQQLNKLINEVYNAKISQQQTELSALNAQINPHFLYNTLDTIYWRAIKNDNNDVADMIFSLSQLFRVSLSKGESFVTVEKEIFFIENYLKLQKMRLLSRLEYTINIDNILLDKKVPKLLIQPFVENSIIHVAENTDEVTNIKISGLKLENTQQFTIWDNGSGLTDVDIILDQDNFDQTNKFLQGYAISNIRNRLSLYFGENFNIHIKSDKENGTQIIITIPI